MVTNADKVSCRDGRCERDHLVDASLPDVLVAYRAAVARRDELVRAYVTLCWYEPTPSGCGSDWHLELISN